MPERVAGPGEIGVRCVVVRGYAARKWNKKGELQVVEHEINIALDNLDSWAKPRVTEMNLFNFPAKGEIVMQPRGVVLIMSAWNYNLLLALQPLVGAIAAGNCAVVKPGSYSVNSSKVIQKLIKTYLDPDAYDAVLGNRDVTTALLEHRWDLICFTGSSSVGKIIAEKAAKFLTPCVLELGGKSPCIIDENANLAVAAKRIAWGATLNAGQTCIRPDYSFVHESVAAAFVTELKRALKDLLGEDAKQSENFGRVIDDKAFTRISGLMADAENYRHYGGQVDAKTRYIEPTIYVFPSVTVFSKAKVMQEEVFGPLLPICPYRDLATTVQFIRERDQPLAAYYFGDRLKAETFIQDTSSGAVVINDVVVHLINEHLPFGGVGASGTGRYHGHYSFQTFSHEKPVLRRSQGGDFSIRYPPYCASKQRTLRLLTTPAIHRTFTHLCRLVTVKNALWAILLFMLFRRR
eukprot:GEMP01017838.1.p1 GENE.GEMP01017838.1~~GEMP01017838.1.p1  ORF type:complete len:463 (+),score=92.77 GEMP01017838.1:185-1573(+)